MKYWVFTGKEALGPYAPDELKAVAGFGPETVVAPDGAGSADAWKPARTFPELQALFVKPPVPKAPEPAPVAETPKLPEPAALDGFFCPQCDHRIATQDLCCANCAEMLPPELRSRYLASLGPAAAGGPDKAEFWKKYALYVALGLAGLAISSAVMRRFQRKSAQRAQKEEAARAAALPPIDIKIPAARPPREEAPDSTDLAAPSAKKTPARKRPESRATLAERRAKKPEEAPPAKKSAAEMSVDELTKYLNRGKK